MVINFITNHSFNEVSGGFSGMNAIAFKAISDKHDVKYVGPVNPAPFKSQVLFSKFQKAAGIPRSFFLFSEKRLAAIARQVAGLCNPSADLDFYHGFTPWIRCVTPRPYMGWSDCTFPDYLEIFHKGKHYRRSEIRRISEGEKKWVEQAKAIFLSSKWAQARLLRNYGVNPQKLASVGIFGGLEPPASDTWNGSRDFYFISSDYRLKNGTLCRKAMDEVWKRYPEVRLIILGAKPADEDLVPKRVIYEGFFKKSDPVQLLKFRGHLSNAFALLHPTEADITPLTLIEAAFFGCPSITVNDFAIPEVLGKTESGHLLERPVTAQSMANAILKLLDNPEAYKLLRQSARARALRLHTIPIFCSRIQNVVQEAFVH